MVGDHEKDWHRVITWMLRKERISKESVSTGFLPSLTKSPVLYAKHFIVLMVLTLKMKVTYFTSKMGLFGKSREM